MRRKYAHNFFRKKAGPARPTHADNSGSPGCCVVSNRSRVRGGGAAASSCLKNSNKTTKAGRVSGHISVEAAYSTGISTFRQKQKPVREDNHTAENERLRFHDDDIDFEAVAGPLVAVAQSPYMQRQNQPSSMLQKRKKLASSGVYPHLFELRMSYE